MRKELTTKEIMELIPHRYPFLLLDRITEMEAGKRAVGLKNVTINEPFFEGHFPGQPIMPGVLIVEAMAQLGAAAVLCRDEYKGKLLLFRGFDNVHFRDVVRPGDTLHLETTLTAMRGRVGRGKGLAFVDGRVVASAEITFAIADRI